MISALLLAVAVGTLSSMAGGGVAHAGHWYKYGWRDSHVTFPTRPNGLSAIKSTFGQPCNSDAYYNKNFTWVTSLPDATYTPSYHKKLGGKGQVGWFTRTTYGGSNVIESVIGHLGNEHYLDQVRGGIGNYNCRKISGSSSYSTHAWGIAWDINWNYETNGDCTANTVTPELASRWQSHNFYWGDAFCDAMHFQYATGY